MPLQIPNGSLGQPGREAVIDYLVLNDLQTSRLGAIPPDVTEKIGIPNSPAQKKREVEIATQIVDWYLRPDASPHDFSRMEGIVMDLQAILIRGFGSLEAVHNKRVLDLACGSSASGTGPYRQPIPSFDPWMCRLIEYPGGKAIGVDIRPQQDELFEWPQIDLNINRSLSFLDDQSIDAYYCANFYPVQRRPLKVLHQIEWDNRSNQIATALKRVLKSDALILYPEQLGSELLSSNSTDT